jgi:Ca2+/H+ antiporter, TMEM165/GDT1 family
VDLAVVALTFAAIFVVELPDKTFIATLVLSTRFRPLLVWLGVGLAFAVQTGIAVGLGKAASFLPTDVVRGGAAVLFLAGSALLFRAARTADAEEAGTEAEYAERAGRVSQGSTSGTDSTTGTSGGWKAVAASFLVLFAAEWGDLSQLLTLSLVAKYDDPVSVFLGAFGALLAVSGLAVLVGRALLNRVSLRLLHYVGGSVCLVLAAITLGELLS